MKTSESQNQQHTSNTRSDQPFFGAKPEQAFFSRGQRSAGEASSSQPEPFFKKSNPSLTNPSVSPIQAKLTVGAVGDRYEQEADRVATAVVEHINTPLPQSTRDQVSAQRMEGEEEDLQMKLIGDTIQRIGEEEDLQMQPLASHVQRMETEEEDLQMKLSPDSTQRMEMEDEEDLQMQPMAEVMQRKAMDNTEDLHLKPVPQQMGHEGGTVAADLERKIQRARGGGQALAPALQARMGQTMGADFSGVQVHTDKQADQLNRSIQAKAFTTGQDIFFQQGMYNPGSRGGQELIAHELTHVVQQGGSVVRRQTNSSHTPNCSCPACSGQRSNRQPPKSIQRVSEVKQIPQVLIDHAKDSKLQRVVHENVATTQTRLEMPDDFLGGDDALYHMAEKITDVMKIPNTINITSDKNVFIREYAKYLSIQQEGDESKTDEKLGQAKTQLEDANCRGFTNQKSQTWYYGDQPALSDAVHEMVHILSARGGLTGILADYGAGLNEGFTHLFTTKVCNLLGIQVNPAYQQATAFAKQLEAEYGISLIYQAYFKGNMNLLLTAMADKWKGYAESGVLGNGSKAGWGDKNKSTEERINLIKPKLRAWQSDGMKWLKPRIL
ncbi:MAG: DUF4157 domain-containing protein [Cyanothece sp. SIO1E1]|nr:DUF4157 domain-containing protein [Cyanothece sp. SIO1E1]